MQITSLSLLYLFSLIFEVLLWEFPKQDFEVIPFAIEDAHNIYRITIMPIE